MIPRRWARPTARRTFFRSFRTLGVGVVAAACMAVAGCGPGFAPPNRLNSPRVLGIRSEPVRPFVGETSTLSAVTYTPDDVPLIYDWSWCPVALGPGVACPFTDADVTPLGAPSLHLASNDDGTATFVHSIPAETLTALCSGTAAGMSMFPAPDCTDGFPIQLQLTICTDKDPANCTDAAHAVQAVRPMLLRFRDTDQGNANPSLGGLQAVIMGQPADLQGASPPMLTRNKEAVIKVVLEVAKNAEMYMGKDDNGNPAQLTERLTLSWFVESGDTNHQRTSYIAGTSASGDATTQIKWTPSFKKDEKDSLRSDTDVSKVIVVIRDDRDGVGAIQGSAQLVEATTP